MGESRCELSQLVNWYREFLENGKSAAFVSCVSTRYDTATLIRLTASSDHESRRAAVLALGMAGSREAMKAVGACMRDRDRCVRLVAEIAFGDICRREFGDAAFRQLQIARRHLDGGRVDRAEQMLDQIVRAWPRFAEAWHLKALVQYTRKEYVRTISLTRRVAAMNSEHFASHAMEGKAWVDLGKPARALACFRRSFGINPSQTLVQGYIEVLDRQLRAGQEP